MGYNEIQDFADQIQAAGKSGIIVTADEEGIDVKFAIDDALEREEAFMTFIASITAVISAGAEGLGVPTEMLCDLVCAAAQSDLLSTPVEEAEPSPVMC